MERADVIGWSDGARVALLLASRHPERVRRVVMSGISTTPDGFDPKFLKWLRERSPAQMADEMKDGHGTFHRRPDWLMPMIYSFLDAPENTTK